MAIITSPARVHLAGIDLAPYIDSRYGIQLTDWQREVVRRLSPRRKTIRIDGYWGPSLYELMPTIRAWLEANGIPPSRVLITEVPRVDRRRRTIRLRVLDNPVRIDYRRDQPITRPTAVHLAVRPPAELRAWLRGKVRP